jgi:NTE family protein
MLTSFPSFRNIFLSLVVFILAYNETIGQKTGIVLSGGGASGMAHIGFLKALEKEGIPIDYIGGTSIGAYIAGLYASGYSPDEIEAIVKSEDFIRTAKGETNPNQVYYFKKQEENASWLNLRFDFESGLKNNIPVNFINSVPLDFKMMQVFMNPSAAANYNFDSLFVPFRCVASDIGTKQTVVFRNGDLTEAIRASMTYPFYLRPIAKDGRLLFDGGLYDNFPAQTINREFAPDIIIGCTVTENSPDPNEEDLYLQLRTMMMAKTNFNTDCENGIIITPFSDVGLFDFQNAQLLIDSGYVATMRGISQIKQQVRRIELPENIELKRKKFRSTFQPTSFAAGEITGVNRRQKSYIEKLLFKGKKELTFTELEKKFFQLANDDKIKYLYPTAHYDSLTGKYRLNVIVKEDKKFLVQLGGNFSNRPISEGFLGLQYNYLGKRATTFYGNTYFGKFNTSAMGKVRVDFPGRTPFFLESAAYYSYWDYFKSSNVFYDLEVPPYLKQQDVFGEINFGVPVGNHGKLIIGGGVSELENIYYQDKNFTIKDTADRTFFDFGFGSINYYHNSLNRKQYASEGKYFAIHSKFVNGFEYLYPGTTAVLKDTLSKFHQWIQVKGVADVYLKTSRKFKIGLYAEAAYYSQGFFNNYTSTILTAPAFMPTPESRTLFLTKYRAHKYVAGGLKFIFHPMKNLDVRTEGYIFQPFNSILEDQNRLPYYSQNFLYRHFIAMGALVYHSPAGPVSFSVNYYEAGKESFTYLIHFGYTLFNKKSLD